MAGLVDRLLTGDMRALARLATLVEANDPLGVLALDRLYPHTGHAHVVGITGPPGVGKSTLVNALIGAVRQTERRVGVIAVDPSSPISGGAVLGDRIRMMEQHTDSGVFIRSMATRGRLGGVAAATAGVIHLMDAASFPLILVETIGTGQDGVDIASLAQTVIVVQVPGLGDGVQAIKAGVLEVGDILVVNKADRPGAEELSRLLRQTLSLALDHNQLWTIPVRRTVAATGDGIARLMADIDEHQQMLRGSGEWERRLFRAAQAEVLSQMRREIDLRLTSASRESAPIVAAIDGVAHRRIAPNTVVQELLSKLDLS